MRAAFIWTTIFLQGVTGGTIDISLQSFKEGTKDIIIEFPSVISNVLVDPSIVSSVLHGDDQRNLLISLIQKKTSISQTLMVNALKTLNVFKNSEQFWVSNCISLPNASPAVIQALSNVPGTFTIRESVTSEIGPIPPEDRESEYITYKADALQWGVKKIGADKLHAKGITGKGVIVCIIDSGVNAEHIALKSNYKNDAASWKDAYKQYSTPADKNGHGTHCAGIAVGTTNGIGVAPEAKWIACRALDDKGHGTESKLLTCMQWAACPARVTGASGRCYGFPNIISNSWGGGQNKANYNQVIQTWQALNIIPVFAIGNDGSKCSTAGSPGDQLNLISVGATDINDKIADFSSRGPRKGSSVIKPELSAPGKSIISADARNVNKYRTLSGTSMATPHVAGAIALLLQENRNYNFRHVSNRLYQTAEKDRLEFNGLSLCSNSNSTAYTNVYGHGRIDIFTAVNK